MLSKETCEKIWHCHREIETGEKLLADIKEVFEKNKYAPDAQALKDVFGKRRDMQLGVPSGQNSHRIFDVSYDLAEPIIRTHMRKRLVLRDARRVLLPELRRVATWFLTPEVTGE